MGGMKRAAFIRGKQETADSAPASLIVLHHRPVREVSTCNCLHGGEQPKFLSSLRPARPSLPASRWATVQAARSRLNAFIPPLAQPSKSKNCILVVGRQATVPALITDACVRPCSVSPLPRCTVFCHCRGKRKLRPLIVFTWHTWGLGFIDMQLTPPGISFFFFFKGFTSGVLLCFMSSSCHL